MMSNKVKQVDSIPDEFASYEEAAEFWDTHDTTDYLSSFETVSVDAEGSSPLGGGGLEQGGGTHARPPQPGALPHRPGAFPPHPGGHPR
jgi:hypothetical protein